MFPANTSRTLFYLPLCFPSASASGKSEQRRVRVVAFGLAVSIFPLCQPAHGDASGVRSGPVTLTAREDKVTAALPLLPCVWRPTDRNLTTRSR
jgi:hypothetical protein